MARKVSVKAAKADARVQADQLANAVRKKAWTVDSFQNFGLNLGMGTDNALADSTYGFNPISRQRTLLEWIHRGSWLGGVAVDLVADDMTRAGVEFGSVIKPDQGDRMHANAVSLAIWDGINDTVKWGRLYGGSLAVLQIEGQPLDTPLRVETVGRGMFRGLLSLDRWMVEPSLTDLVTEMGPSLGMPKFYTVNADAPAFRNQRIHHTRVIRLEGTRLPWNQRIGENLWGLSVYERLYDRMIAFDSASQGAAQLVYKSSIRTYKVNQMRQLIGGDAQAQMMLSKYVEMMRRFQGVEGVTLIDSEDDFVMSSNNGFAGIGDALAQFGQQISGALQIPLVRLFGQSPGGLNSSGSSDLVTYYDGIKHQQERWLKTGVDRIYRCIAASMGIPLPPEFAVRFRPLWQLNDNEKTTAAQQLTGAIVQAFDSGVVSRGTALRELKQGATVNGAWSNITDEEIEDADKEPAPAPEGYERDEQGNLMEAAQPPVPGMPGAEGFGQEQAGAAGGDGGGAGTGTEEGGNVVPMPKAASGGGGKSRSVTHIHQGDAAAGLPELTEAEVDEIARALDKVEAGLIARAYAKRATKQRKV